MWRMSAGSRASLAVVVGSRLTAVEVEAGMLERERREDERVSAFPESNPAAQHAHSALGCESRGSDAVVELWRGGAAALSGSVRGSVSPLKVGDGGKERKARFGRRRFGPIARTGQAPDERRIKRLELISAMWPSSYRQSSSSAPLALRFESKPLNFIFLVTAAPRARRKGRVRVRKVVRGRSVKVAAVAASVQLGTGITLEASSMPERQCHVGRRLEAAEAVEALENRRNDS